VGRALWAIASTALGRRRFPDPPELAAARQLMTEEATACNIVVH